jgi:hypothetical protein
MNKTMLIVVVLVLGYFVGAKWPAIANRIGVA